MGKNITDFPTYEVLPFIVDTAVLKMKGASIRTHSELLDTETGELISGSMTISDREVDPTRFMKLYYRGFPNISRLNPSGLKMMLYIMWSMGSNVEKITIDIGECMAFCRYTSRNPLYKGLVNLLEHGILAVSTGKMSYWINPNIFYNGNPVNTVKRQIANPPARFIKWKEMDKSPYVGDRNSLSDLL